MFDLFLCIMVYRFPATGATEHPETEIVAPPRPISLWSSLGLDADDFDFDTVAQDAYVGEVVDEPPNGYVFDLPAPKIGGSGARASS